MNNEVLTVLENCKDFIEQIKDDSLAKYLIKEIDTTIENRHHIYT
jgi:translation initiation factor 2 beta subunit (eIF-2beta)/eIF-5